VVWWWRNQRHARRSAADFRNVLRDLLIVHIGAEGSKREKEEQKWENEVRGKKKRRRRPWEHKSIGITREPKGR